MDERTEPDAAPSTTDTVALALIAVVMALAEALDREARERFQAGLDRISENWARDDASPALRHASARMLGPAVTMLRNLPP